MQAPRDAVAVIADQWRQERPELDVTPLLVIARMQRLVHLFEPHLRPTFEEAGLANGDFDVLAALRRAGRPFTLSAGQLSGSLLVTTGAISKRIDRLEGRRLVRRTVSSSDARGRLITLSSRGVRLTDQLIDAHLANEGALLAGLNRSECRDLAALLARLAEAHDGAGQSSTA